MMISRGKQAILIAAAAVVVAAAGCGDSSKVDSGTAPEPRLETASGDLAPAVVYVTYEEDGEGKIVGGTARASSELSALNAPLLRVLSPSTAASAGSGSAVVGYGADGVVMAADVVSGRSFAISGAPLGSLPAAAQRADRLAVAAAKNVVQEYALDGTLIRELSVTPPPFEALTVNGAPAKITVDPSVAFVTALLPDPDGGWIAIAENAVNSRVQRVGGKDATQDIEGLGHVLAAAVSASGELMIAGWDERQSPQEVVVYVLDASSLRVERTIRTGMTPNRQDQMLQGAEMKATQDGHVYLLLPTLVKGVNESNPDIQPNLFEVEGDSVKSIELPNNIGTHIVPGEVGHLLIFGGVAENIVSDVEIESARVTTSKEYQAPPGSFVVALTG